MAEAKNIVDAEYLKQIEGARKDLFDLMQKNKQFTPIVLRTYDAKTKTGGANGSIRTELNNPANNGIKLAGVIAVEVTGGPFIPFIPGRPDAPNQQDKGELPNPNGGAQHLRDIFYRMGLNDRDIVVLSGSHTLGRANQDRSGFDGPFTEDPFKFDNAYFFPTDKALVEDPAFSRYVQLYAK
ncbi:L-ascorbate peroxidase 5 peroxisomal, partial [Bienertia sinuspersici]